MRARRGNIYLGAGEFDTGAVVGAVSNVALAAFGQYTQLRLGEKSLSTQRDIANSQARAQTDIAIAQQQLADVQQQREERMRKDLMNYAGPVLMVLAGLGVIYFSTKKKA